MMHDSSSQEELTITLIYQHLWCRRLSSNPLNEGSTQPIQLRDMLKCDYQAQDLVLHRGILVLEGYDSGLTDARAVD